MAALPGSSSGLGPPGGGGDYKYLNKYFYRYLCTT